MKKKLAVFDVDGTLFDGNLGIDFLKVLIREKIFPESVGKEIYGWYGRYKSGEVEKGMAVDECYKLFALGMKGLDSKTVEKWAVITWNEVKKNMFGFTRELINKLKKDVYEIVLISGSPIEMISKLAKEIGISTENVLAGKLVIKKGKYTGERLSYPAWAKQKIEGLNKVVESNNWQVDWKKSTAMGDDERDVGILGMVGKPMAFRPSEKLREIAKEKGWRVVEED